MIQRLKDGSKADCRRRLLDLASVLYWLEDRSMNVTTDIMTMDLISDLT